MVRNPIVIIFVNCTFRRVATGLLLTMICTRAWGDDGAVSFRTSIAPILLDNCLACHGPKKAEGGYRVDTYDELLKAGDSGELPITTASDQTSELLRRITCDDESERMPPESEPLTPEQIELVRKWITAGGKFDGENPSKNL